MHGGGGRGDVLHDVKRENCPGGECPIEYVQGKCPDPRRRGGQCTVCMLSNISILFPGHIPRHLGASLIHQQSVYGMN